VFRFIRYRFSILLCAVCGDVLVSLTGVFGRVAINVGFPDFMNGFRLLAFFGDAASGDTLLRVIIDGLFCVVQTNGKA
jgi:hypothetical protein